MRVFGRHDGGLAVGLLVATLIVFVRPLSYLLEIAHDVEGTYGLALLPGLLILTVFFAFHVQSKRFDMKAETAAATAAASLAEQRARDLERLVEFGHALARALDIDAIRDTLLQHLPRMAGGRDLTVLLRSGNHWEPLLGSGQEEPQPGRDTQRQLAERALEDDAHRRHPEGLSLDRYVAFPLVAGGMQIGAVILSDTTEPLGSGERRMLAAAAALLAVSIRNAQLFREVKENGLRDALTGCFNRAHALEALEIELKRARRSQMPVSLLLFDIDHFKTINDSHGHLAGDAVLAAVGRRMIEVLRSSDLKCRWGGEEFLVLLPETPLEGAKRVAETLRRELAATTVQWRARSLTVTASFGVTVAGKSEIDIGSLIGRADQALYRAKDEGRNCVRVVSDPVAA